MSWNWKNPVDHFTFKMLNRQVQVEKRRLWLYPFREEIGSVSKIRRDHSLQCSSQSRFFAKIGLQFEIEYWPRFYHGRGIRNRSGELRLENEATATWTLITGRSIELPPVLVSSGFRDSPGVPRASSNGNDGRTTAYCFPICSRDDCRWPM